MASSPSAVTRTSRGVSAGSRHGTPPTPTLPLGAGGPPRRAAGRGLRSVVVLDDDPLRRSNALAAARAIGLIAEAPPDDEEDAAGAAAGASRAGRAVAGWDFDMAFVAIDSPEACPRCAAATVAAGSPPCPGDRRATWSRRGAVITVGYGVLGAVLAAHRRHSCTDLVLLLTARHGAPAFVYLPPVTAVDVAGLTPREADVLVLLLAGLDGPRVARRLQISPATVRSHRRAVLRKLGAGDRRSLCAALLDAAQPGGPALTAPGVTAGPR